jgi:transcriptional repressor NrdR
MKCPFCSTDNDRVIDSRAIQEGFVIRRRRECVGCQRRFTTYERLEEIRTKIVKKDGCREPFDPAKIRKGLEKACWKRPIASEEIEKIVSSVEAEIYERLEPEVESGEVGEMVMDQLRTVDQVAFVRFASVYREFKDVADFVDELQPILRERRKAARQSRDSAERSGNRAQQATARPGTPQAKEKDAGGSAGSTTQ